MRRIVTLWAVCCSCAAMLVGLVPVTGYAEAVTGPALAIRQVKISGDEFVVLQNYSTNALELSDYWLGYASSDTATNIVPTQQLPNGLLEPGAAVLLNNGVADTCDAVLVTDLAFSSLSDSKGTLALRKLTNDGNVSSFTTVDSISWGKLATDGIQIANEAQVPDGANVAWYRDTSATQPVWRVGDYRECTLYVTVISNTPPPAEVLISWETAAGSPPSIVVSTVSSVTSTGASIPAADRGLKAVQLSEILPNPASPLTDAEDEFIELYNPNTAPFDLSGFQLQIGSTTSSSLKTYTFPDGTKLAPHAFKAFKAETTHLSLSNSGGQVWLVDPLNRTVAESNAYGAAKDGQAWVYASGKWQWTTMSTPDATNKIAAPAAASSSKKTATVNGRTVTAVKAASAAAASATGGTMAPAAAAAVTPIHPLTLVIVLLLALLYGAYEYRHDVANRLYQFQKYRAARRTAGK